MNTRYTGILLICGAILAAGLIVTTPRVGGVRVGEQSRSFFGERPAAEIDFLGVARGSEVVSLYKEGGKWYTGANNFHVDQFYVEPLLEVLGTRVEGVLVSRDPANHIRYGVSDDQGVALVLERSPINPAKVFIGNIGPDRRSNFVRAGGSDLVYMVPRRIEEFLVDRKKEDDWRSPVIFSFNPQAILSVEVVDRGERLTLVRSERGWHRDSVTSDAMVDTALVGALLNAFNDLRASGFEDDPSGGVQSAVYGMEAPQFEATLIDAGKRELRLRVGHSILEGDSRFFAHDGRSSGLFVLTSYYLDERLRGALAKIEAHLAGYAVAPETGREEEAATVPE